MELWVPFLLLVDLNALVPWWHQPPEQLIRLCISYFPLRESLLLLAVCGKLLLLSLLICVLVSKCLSLCLFFLRHQDYLNCVTFTLSSGIHCNENTLNITKIQNDTACNKCNVHGLVYTEKEIHVQFIKAITKYRSHYFNNAFTSTHTEISENTILIPKYNDTARNYHTLRKQTWHMSNYKAIANTTETTT